MGRWILMCAVIMGSASLAWGQIPVTDAGAAAQRVVQIANQAAAYIRQGQQIINEYNQIRNQIIQINHMVTNLKRIPEEKGLNFFQAYTTYSARLEGLMSQATMLSFQLDRVTTDFTRLYGEAQAAVQTGDILITKRRLNAATLETAQIAMQAQAMKGNILDIYGKLQRLLDGSWTAPGALHSAQVQAQQAALLQHTQQEMATMAAANYRLLAMDAARKAALEQQALAAYEKAMTLAPIGQWQAGPVVDIVVPPEEVRRAGN